MNSLGYILLAMLYVGSLSVLYLPDILPEKIHYEHEQGWIEPYFCQTINCSFLLVNLINQSENVTCAFYDLEEKNVLEALRDKEVVLFDENADEEYHSPFKTVSSKSLMHHKFCIFDNSFVLTGSWNPTNRGTYKNDNAVVLIASKKAAHFYMQAYNHLLNRTNTVSPLHLNLSGTRIDGYICPQHHCEQKVIQKITAAKKSIHILAFSFTSKPIAKALLDSNLSGTIIFEKTRISKYSQHSTLKNSTFEVYTDTNPYTMHEKIFLLDNTTTIIGSYNPTKNANERNDENLLIIEDTDFFKKTNEEFMRIQHLTT